MRSIKRPKLSHFGNTNYLGNTETDLQLAGRSYYGTASGAKALKLQPRS